MRTLSSLTQPVVLPIRDEMPRAGSQVWIVLASYNGAAYIEHQIRSICQQTWSDWQLYVRDDHSRDDTVARVQAMAAQDPRIHLLPDLPGEPGAVGNFAALLHYAAQHAVDYLFFADQDDDWPNHKLACQLAAMQRLEAEHGRTTPLLVHSDLALVDADLQPLAPSFVASSGLFPTQADLGVLLCQNQITGCATLINQALLKLAAPLPVGVRMHDWWLALLAASCGKIGYLPQALVNYRQHGRNAVGASSRLQRMRQALNVAAWRRYQDIMRRNVQQAQSLLQRLDTPPLAAEVRTQITLFAHIAEQPRWRRVSLLRQHLISPHLPAARWAVFAFITLL